MKRYLILAVYCLVILQLSSEQAIAQGTGNYEGYRLYISAVGVYQTKPNWVRIHYMATNTGRRHIKMSKRQPLPNMQIRFDESLNNNDLLPYAETIREALMRQSFDLKPGEYTDTKYLKFFTNAASYGVETEVLKRVDKTEVEETVMKVEEKVKGKNTESSIEASTADGGDSLVVAEERTNLDSLFAEVKIKTDTLTSVIEKAAPASDTTLVSLPSASEEGDFMKNKYYCPDLVFSNIQIKDQSKKSVTLIYTIKNQGVAEVDLFGKDATKNDNAAIIAYMSGSPRLSRGAIQLKGVLLTKGDGFLKPQGEYTGEIKISIKTLTRYTPNIILSLDAFRVCDECDTSNNTTHVLVR